MDQSKIAPSHDCPSVLRSDLIDKSSFFNRKSSFFNRKSSFLNQKSSFFPGLLTCLHAVASPCNCCLIFFVFFVKRILNCNKSSSSLMQNSSTFHKRLTFIRRRTCLATWGKIRHFNKIRANSVIVMQNPAFSMHNSSF